MQKSNIYKPLFWGMLFFMVMYSAYLIALAVESEKLSNKVGRLAAELNEAAIIEEGEIVSVEDLETGGVIYVLYEGGGKSAIIEVDVFPEIIYTSIEVGDTAIYCRDRNWTDADLLAIEKREPEVDSKTQKIIEYALADIDAEGYATLYFVGIKEVPWSDYDEATYILTVNGKMYTVGVQEKGDEVHFVDVIDELYTV